MVLHAIYCAFDRMGGEREKKLHVLRPRGALVPHHRARHGWLAPARDPHVLESRAAAARHVGERAPTTTLAGSLRSQMDWTSAGASGHVSSTVHDDYDSARADRQW
jgi:hypothetical protein